MKVQKENQLKCCTIKLRYQNYKWEDKTQHISMHRSLQEDYGNAYYEKTMQSGYNWRPQLWNKPVPKWETLFVFPVLQ